MSRTNRVLFSTKQAESILHLPFSQTLTRPPPYRHTPSLAPAQGHYELFICNADELPDGVDSEPTQECFNKYPLNRDPDYGSYSPIDPAYPGRYFTDPECTASETNYPNESQYDDDDGWTMRMHYLMPADLECGHCVLQAVYRECRRTAWRGGGHNMIVFDWNLPSWR